MPVFGPPSLFCCLWWSCKNGLAYESRQTLRRLKGKGTWKCSPCRTSTKDYILPLVDRGSIVRAKSLFVFFFQRPPFILRRWNDIGVVHHNFPRFHLGSLGTTGRFHRAIGASLLLKVPWSFSATKMVRFGGVADQKQHSDGCMNEIHCWYECSLSRLRSKRMWVHCSFWTSLTVQMVFVLSHLAICWSLFGLLLLLFFDVILLLVLILWEVWLMNQMSKLKSEENCMQCNPRRIINKATAWELQFPTTIKWERKQSS